MTVPPTDREMLERALEHGAILGHVLRKFARAHHRTHARDLNSSWFNCHEHFCAMARLALDGKYTIANRTAHGTVVSLVPKAADGA